MNLFRVLVLLAMCFSSQAWAEISVDKGWVRLLPPMVKTTAAYMNITSSQDDVLYSASSPVAERVELHFSSMSNGVMSMDHIETMALKKGKVFALKPGSYHIMVIGLKKSLSEGERVPITLKFEKAGEVVIKLPVKR